MTQTINVHKGLEFGLLTIVVLTLIIVAIIILFVVHQTDFINYMASLGANFLNFKLP